MSAIVTFFISASVMVQHVYRLVAQGQLLGDYTYLARPLSLSSMRHLIFMCASAGQGAAAE